MLARVLLVALVAAAAARAQGASGREASCVNKLTRDTCLGGANCCWHTGGLHMAATHKATCVSCIKIAAPERAKLGGLWRKWEYNINGNLPDGNVEEILCPNLANVANHRVSCDDDGHVTDLLLGNDRLYGEMKDVCDLVPSADYLETLTLTGNYLWGPLPTCVAQFTKLKQFWVEHNYLRGALPDLKPLEQSLNQQSEVKTVDCRLVANANYLRNEFGPDNNCFECGGGFDSLPAQCQPAADWENKCRFYKGTDQDCPTDNGMPAKPAPPMPKDDCTEDGTLDCKCKPGNSCGIGLVCSNGNVCLKSESIPIRCQVNPATIGCPCNPMTGMCATPDLKCKDPEIICVEANGAAAGAPSALLALVATLVAALVAALA
mmetsp:Transcript_26237/g.63788  ORF Transcript_26237/g.63788 Transcript_26237/m.63788 type:complete len:377 (+) Transcript_26237:103-1233(+)